MVKLATAREARLYGPALTVRRWEYINAGAYVFGTLLLAAGLTALCASSDRGVRAAGLVVAAAALVVVAAVNAHDLGAHLAGVDCRVGLVRFDPQLALVELLVPALHAAGCVLAVVGVAFLLSQGDGRERHAANTMLAGALLWLLGSALNSCQVYERADGRAQLLQSSVQVPVLVGSLLFLVAAVLNCRRARQPVERWTMWLCGSVLWVTATDLTSGTRPSRSRLSDSCTPPRCLEVGGAAHGAALTDDSTYWPFSVQSKFVTLVA